jgi:16S rRNA (guanine527-N7)-methyltransferase
MVEHLLLDSVLFTRILPGEAQRVMDLGSGAGLPGIPIKIVCPGLALTLVEAGRRRSSFLSAVVRDLGLTEVTVVSERFERVAEGLAGAFDAVVMRCPGRTRELVRRALAVVRPGGIVVGAGPPEKPADLPREAWVEIEDPISGARRGFIVERRG